MSVRRFRNTGRNPYNGNATAVAEGRAAYQQHCAACHLEDGTGRIGSSLVDRQYNHPRTNSSVGVFEVIYGGGTGAMQPFAGRIALDDILKIMAYIDSLPRK